MPESATAPVPARRAAVVFIFITVVIDVIALGIIIPVLPQLFVSFEGGNTARGAQVLGLFGTAWALMQFFFSPVLGALSDRFGRRPVILLSITGLGLDYAFMALAPSLGWLFVGRILSGITASGFATAAAYIADVTPPEKRAAGFGMIGAAFGLGFVLGPALGGLLGQVHLRLPFAAASVLALVNAAYGLFVLPESLPPEKRAPFRWRNANPLASLTLLRSHPGLLGLAGVTFLYFVAHDALPTTFVLYASYRFDWSAFAVGMSLAAVGVTTAVMQGGLIRPINKALGERRTGLLGLACGVVSFAGFGLASAGWMLYAAIVVNAFWSLYGPASQALMTARVEPGAQGRLQGALAGLHSLTAILAPLIFPIVFAWAISPGAPWHQPGAPFLLASAILALAFVSFAVVTRKA